MFVVTIDKAAFLTEVQKYLDMSPVYKEWDDVKILKWPDALVPPQFWTTIKDLSELISVVCAAVEVAKQNIIKLNDPDGTKGAKFDREIALAVAAETVASLVVFKGMIGSIVNKLWRPLINVLVSIYVNQQPSDWVSLAVKILMIVLK
jgi:hypothetical protein